MDKHNEFPENFSLTAGERIAGDDLSLRDESQPFYEGGQRRYIIDQAIHHLHFDTAAVLILGEEGSGKTTVLDQLLNELQESMDGCLLDVEAIGPAGLLPELIAGLDLHDVVDFTCENVAYAAEQRRNSVGLPLLVTLDNAELMSTEQVDALFEVARLSHGSIRLLICGDVSLQAKADRAAQGEAIFALQLPPLSRAEVGEYLQFLARRRGQLGRLALPSESLQKIYLGSHGNIALVNRYAEDLFSAGSGISAFKWRDITRMPLLHIGLVSALVVFLLVMKFTGNESSTETEVVNPVASVPGNTDLQSSNQPANQQQPTEQQSADHQIVSTELALPPPVASSSESSTANPALASSPQAEQLSSAPSVSNAPQAATTSLSSAPEVAAISEQPESQVEEARPEPKPAAKPKTTNSGLANGGGRGDKDLLAMPSSSFVLQVFASHDKTRVSKFVKTYQSKVKISYFESRHNGKPWFVAVVAGPYKSSDKAKAAVAKLPSDLRNQKPWPRQLSSIQQDIRALN